MKKTIKNKPKISFWRKIINIYNNNPWHASFTYPIIYIIVVPIMGTLITAPFAGLSKKLNDEFAFNLSTIGMVGGLIIAFSFVLTPIWVAIGLIVSDKKLPYLLSLIIGLSSAAILLNADPY